MAEQKEKRTYTRDIKVEAVRLYESSDKSMSEVARELGITRDLLSKWVQQTRDEELHELRCEIEVLKQEREILKKAVLIPSPSSGQASAVQSGEVRIYACPPGRIPHRADVTLGVPGL